MIGSEFLTLTPAEIQAFSFAFLFFVTGIASFFIFSTNYRDKTARLFAWTAFFGSLINLFSYLYHTTDDLEIARLLRVISQAFILPFVWGLMWFSIHLYEKYLPARRALRLGAYFFAALITLGLPFFVLDLLGSHFLIGAVTQSTEIQLSPEPGPLMIFHIAAFTCAALYMAYVLALLWRRGITREARVMGMLMFLCAVVPTLTRIVGYAPWYALSDVGLSSLLIVLLSGPVFGFGTTYAILRHQVFSLRLVAAQVFIFALWSFIFFKAVLADSWNEAFPDLALLVATIVLGIFLIRSVLQEVTQREKLEKVSADLKVLNETLETKVMERTEDLAQARAHVESIIENLPVGIIEASEDFLVTRVNRAAEEMLGASRGRVVGQRFRDPALSSFTRVLHATPGTQDPGEERASAEAVAELSITEPQKRELQVVTVGIALGRGERGIIKLIRDVTREKLVERAKSEFITIAAHQLRTPISGLRWTFNLLRSGEAGRLTKLQKDVIEKGNYGAENLVRIVGDLLNVAKISDGKFDYRFAENDVRQVIEGAVKLMEGAALEKKIRLVSRIAQDIPRFTFDPDKLALAIQNLLDNAIKYTPAEGSVEIAATRSDDRVVISVEDTGIGIPKEDQERLFEKFFRTKRATQMFTDGSGLGLFIVRTIVDAHGGSISVSSQEGKGTTFSLSLPLIHRTKVV